MAHKHTPAPWKITKSEDTNLMSVRDVNGIKISGASPRTDDEANARLIAASPELLEALKSIAENGGSTWDYATIGNVARRAVMLAEGDN